MIDHRRKYILCVDVETANSLEDPLTYDIGFAITDKHGNIYESYSYAIRDIFVGERDLMTTAYYADKLPQYHADLRSGIRKMANFNEVRRQIADLMRKYNTNIVAAYNCAFDRNALNITQRYTTSSKYRWFFPYGTEYYCIWNMATQTICRQKSYAKFCEDNSLISNRGNNYSTSAETVYRYLKQDPNFEEAHQGLADVEIEAQIMARCFRQHRKMDKGINRLCWRNVKREV